MFAARAPPPLFALVPFAPAARDALCAATAGAAQTAAEGLRRAPTFAQWLVELIPANPIRAAADGAMLPLIVFSLLLGLAATRMAPDRRDRLVSFFRAAAETALVLVRWVLRAAPVGVFALALPLAARLGASSAGVVASYVVVVVALSVVFTVLVFYPLAVVGGGVSVARFARAALPAQAVALSARSSLASLPAMMEAARSRLGLREEVVGFLLPLAASTYRIGGAVGMVVATAFLAHLYGVSLGATTLASVVLAATVATFSVPGIPAGSIVGMAPVLMTAGVDLAGLGILIGLDAIPDMFRTASNVTGDMSVATVLGRDRGAREGAAVNAGAAELR
jgi:Na+/H+-dicarboxylate symporter